MILRSQSGVLTVQNCAEILHLPNIFVCRPLRGADDPKDFGPETFEYRWVEREEKNRKRKRRGRLMERFNAIAYE